MSIIYKCDVCGKSVGHDTMLKTIYVDAYEEKGSMAVGRVWRGDACPECRHRIEYEMNAAAMREIKTIELHSEGATNEQD